jgi:hypothetical protein
MEAFWGPHHGYLLELVPAPPEESPLVELPLPAAVFPELLLLPPLLQAAMVMVRAATAVAVMT